MRGWCGIKGDNLHVLGRSNVWACRKLKQWDFLRHHKWNKRQTLLDGTAHSFSLHFLWPWHYFNVTAVSNSFNWKFYILIWTIWNFVELLSKWSWLWIYRYFWLAHVLKGDNWCVSWFHKNWSVGFSWTLLKRSFSNFQTLLWIHQFKPGLMTLVLFQGHSCARIINFRLLCRFLSTVV